MRCHRYEDNRHAGQAKQGGKQSSLERRRPDQQRDHESRSRAQHAGCKSRDQRDGADHNGVVPERVAGEPQAAR